MILPYDEIWVREPRLMVPGQKPMGPVRIDTRNSLADGLGHYYPLNERGGSVAHDIVSGANGTISSGLVYEKDYLKWPDTTTRSITVSSGSKLGGNVLTLFLDFILDGVLSYTPVMFTNHGGTLFYFQEGVVDYVWIANVNSGTGGGGVGNRVTSVLVANGGSGVHFAQRINMGTLITGAAGGTPETPTTGGAFKFGGYGNEWNFSGKVFAAGIWPQRALTPSQAVALLRDPYQFLIPA